jgi:ribosomal protein S18 acetylase RimI-like enzyme
MHITTERFSIRPVEPVDFGAVLDVYRQCEDFLALGPQAHASAEMVTADLRLSQEQGGVFCGIFQPDGRMVGVIDVVPRLYQGDPTLASLDLLMIASSARSVGLGAAVVNAFEAVSRQAGIKTILSGVQVNNPGAIRFWTRVGFQITSGPTLMPDTTTVYALRKDLDDSNKNAGVDPA